MPDIKWIKLTTNMFEDEKIEVIQSLPESDALIVIWLRLLTLAGKTNSGGYVFLTEDIPYTDEMLSSVMHKPITVIKLALATFQKFKMIELDDKGIYISNWLKYQNIDGMERVRELGRVRQTKHRELKKLHQLELACNVTDNVTNNVTVTNVTHIERDIDKERDIISNNTNNSIEPKLSNNPFIAKMQEYLGYPFKTTIQPIPDIGKQLGFISQMIKRGISEEDIFECWKQKVDLSNNDFIPMYWINNDIGNWIKNGKIFNNQIKRGNVNGSTTKGNPWESDPY